MAAAVIAIATAFLCMVSLHPESPAYGDVRKGDIILGSSVEQRELVISQCPSIDAEYASLVGSDGTVYFERNAHSPSQIASITKVMTAIVAVENAAPNTDIGVSEKAALIGESTAGLIEGDSMDLETALKALLVPSGNDAAQAIAETIGAQMIASDPSRGNDPETVFVQAMNDKAAEIGCTDTVYENPHGLDDEEYAGSLHSTAADQAKIAQYAMKNDTIRSIVSGGSTTIEVLREGEHESIDLESTDLMLEMYEYAIGVKTGYTEAAGPCFMGAANKEGFELYAVVLGSSSEDQRFRDAMNMFEWVYEHMNAIPLANSAQYVTAEIDGASKSVPVVAAAPHADWIDKTVQATLSDPEATVTVFDVDGNVTADYTFDELHGDIHAGDKVGTATYLQHNAVVAEQDLIACEDVAAPNLFEGIGIWWSRLIGGFGGAPEHADSQIYNVMPIINNSMSNAA